MALGFGRKKAADAAATVTANDEAAPVAAHAPSSPQGDDLDAFDLDSFADLPTTAAPQNATQNADPFGDLGAIAGEASPASGSAFDFPATPDFDASNAQTTVETTGVHGTVFEATPFETPDFAAMNFDAPATTPTPATTPVTASNFEAPDFEVTEVEPTTLSATEPSALDLDEMFGIEQANAARLANSTSTPAPFVPSNIEPAEPAVPFYEPQVPAAIATESGIEGQAQPKRKAPLAPILGALAVLALAGSAATYFSGQSSTETTEIGEPVPVPPEAPAAPPEAAAPQVVAPQAAPEAPAPAVKPAMQPATKPGAVNPGIAPAAAQLAQMKALWKRGADAKHKGDYEGARRYWNQGLKIQPSNIGFQESIAKLPN